MRIQTVVISCLPLCVRRQGGTSPQDTLPVLEGLTVYPSWLFLCQGEITSSEIQWEYSGKLIHSLRPTGEQSLETAGQDRLLLNEETGGESWSHWDFQGTNQESSSSCKRCQQPHHKVGVSCGFSSNIQNEQRMVLECISAGEMTS